MNAPYEGVQGAIGLGRESNVAIPFDSRVTDPSKIGSDFRRANQLNLSAPFGW